MSYQLAIITESLLSTCFLRPANNFRIGSSNINRNIHARNSAVQIDVDVKSVAIAKPFTNYDVYSRAQQSVQNLATARRFRLVETNEILR